MLGKRPVAKPEYHSRAATEYEDAYLRYRARSIRVAADFRREMRRVLTAIAKTPESFPALDDDYRYALLRRFPFMIVFQIQPERVFVVAVAHTSRKPDYWRNRH
ncbi:MAG TPA: type II toxin-antitoxin system RelE/ParE family toxin [Gemmataceae bacterium]|nr:type II toxin-antitoxin system RelE/ParE family toxin [Gemmataceae bacterium]